MKKNNYAFSLPLAMWIVVIMSLLAYTMLEYIVPFSRDIKWVENSSKAYYQASSSVEEWLYYLNVDRTSETSDNYIPFPSSDISNTYKTVSTWSVIPPAWEWNSQYDSDWNTISQWNPIQLSIWNGYLDLSVDNFNLYIRVPDLDNNIFTDITLSWWTIPIINWQLSSLNNTLYASWSKIIANNIDDDIISGYENGQTLDWKNWSDIYWVSSSFENFYDNNCISSGCIFKASVINPLVDSSNWSYISYLEWKLETGNNIPLRYIKLETSGKSMWFRKDIEVKIPTETVNEAFDFTVFQ